MTDLTDHGEGVALDALIAGTRYVALHSADPGEAGSANELAAANGYARRVATFTRSGSVADNDAEVQFGPATADLGTVTHYSVWDAVSGGNCLWKDELNDSRAWSSGTLTAVPGDFTLELD